MQRGRKRARGYWRGLGSSFFVQFLASPQSLFVLVKAIVQLRHASLPVTVPELRARQAEQLLVVRHDHNRALKIRHCVGKRADRLQIYRRTRHTHIDMSCNQRWQPDASQTRRQHESQSAVGFGAVAWVGVEVSCAPRWLVGSSSTSTCGCGAHTLANCTLAFWPPESTAIGMVASSPEMPNIPTRWRHVWMSSRPEPRPSRCCISSAAQRRQYSPSVQSISARSQSLSGLALLWLALCW